MIFFFVFIVITVSVIWWYLRIRKFRKCLPGFSGPRPLPMIGNMLEVVTVYSTGILVLFQNLLNKYGDLIFVCGTPGIEALVGINYKFTEYILQSTTVIAKARPYRFLNRWLGNGLLTGEGERWKKHRKLFTPAFHFSILEKFLYGFETASNILIEKLDREVGKDSFDIFPYIDLCALDTICESAMGTSINAQKNVHSEFAQNTKTMCRIFADRILSAPKQMEFFYRFSKDYAAEQKAIAYLNNFTENVIKQRRQALLSENGFAKNENDTEVKKRYAFLDLLLNIQVDGEPLSDKVIIEEVNTFLFAGHDTTTAALSFTLYCLANNPEVQEKAMEELISIFGDDKYRPATYKDLQEMKYLEMVIKETLRMYPPVPVIGREVTEDTPFYGGVLPQGLSIGLGVYLLHRNPQVFPNPRKFDPERFTMENQIAREPFSYIPFSAGPRNCIGQKFAMLDLKLVISKVLLHYELLPSIPKHRLILACEAVLKSSTGLYVKIQKRT